MRVIERGGDLIVEDSPGLHWLLGLLFVGVGAIFVLGALGLAHDVERLRWWERALSVGFGATGVAVGLWVLGRSPLSRVYVERGRDRVRVVSVGLRGRRVEEWPVAAIDGVRLAEQVDDDGDTVFQIQLALRDGRAAPVSALWAAGREHLSDVAGRLAAALGVALRPPS